MLILILLGNLFFRNLFSKLQSKTLFSLKGSCSHLKEPCNISEDNCCGEELLSCEGFKGKDNERIYYCGSCFNRKCASNEHCCDSRLICRQGKCMFPLNEPCEESTEAEDSPSNCFNSFFGCSKGVCKACGGRICNSDQECCGAKGYKCDKKLNRCVKFKGCQNQEAACVANEDCCEPFGCKDNLCQGCLRRGQVCNTNENCCEGLYCNGLTCDYSRELGKQCVSSFECKSGFCRSGMCSECANEGTECETALECCNSMLCTRTLENAAKTICSPKKLCGEVTDNCDTVACCDGVCKKGICHSCVQNGGKCDAEADECCLGLICTTNPKQPETAVCAEKALCVELGDDCREGENGDKCCIGVCFKGKCLKYKKEKQACSENTAPCEPPLHCERLPNINPPRYMCSAGKLCVERMHACEQTPGSSSVLPCCEGDCLGGKCQSCLPETFPCELGGAACCPGMSCFRNPQNPSLRLCSPTKLCLEENDSCPSESLSCCSGKCHQGRCQKCVPVGQACEVDSAPCCGKSFCTENPQKAGTRICSLSKLCSVAGEDCSPSKPCCIGTCFRGKCTDCQKTLMECSSKLPNCCEGNTCVTDPERPKTKICSPKSLCVDVGDSCNEGSKCCEGTCKQGKCFFCISEGDECNNNEKKCCEPFQCFLLPFADGKRACSKTKLCQQIHEVCDNKAKFCCTGVCHRGFCELCRKEGENCGELSPACCEEFSCVTDEFDSKFVRCQAPKAFVCKKINEPCSRDEQCCQGLCFNRICIECLNEGSKCDGKGKNLCCGIMRCVTDPSDLSSFVCSPKTLCAKVRESCNEELKCCEGLCFANHCTQCKVEGMRCGMFFAPCCAGLLCVTDPQAPSHKKCWKSKLCIDTGEECNQEQDEKVLSCCKGICHEKKCVDCKSEWEECPNGQCCVGLVCTKSIWDPQKNICSKSKLCAAIFEDCSVAIPCCEGECFKGKCLNCRAKGEECGSASPHCCQGFECFTDVNFPKRRICDTSPSCIDLSRTCDITIGLPCCYGVCFQNMCRYCTVAGKKCGQEEPPCCEGLSCVIEHVNGKYSVCQPKQLCMEKFAACGINGQTCCEGLHCVNNACQNCLLHNETCSTGINSKHCCYGICDLSADGETFKCVEQPIKCVVLNGKCGWGHESKPCCGHLSCFQGKCQTCSLVNSTCLQDYDCCKGMRCSLNRKGTHSICVPFEFCKSEDDFCNQEQNDGCCDGLTCWKSKCKSCLTESYQCDHQDPQRKKCCDGLFCTWRPDGLFQTCEKMPLCIMNDSPCSRNDSKCCTNVCWNGKCRGCAIQNKTCETDEEGCCDPLVCTWNPQGTKKVCNFTKPFCIETFGICKDIKCCDGAFCDPFKICRPCKKGPEVCEHDRECCEGTVCTISSDGKKKFCRESENCVETGGDCSRDQKCCKNLNCWQGECQPCASCNDCEKEIVLCDFAASNNFVNDVDISPIVENFESKEKYERDEADVKRNLDRIKIKPPTSNSGGNSKGKNPEAIESDLEKLSKEYDSVQKKLKEEPQNQTQSHEKSILSKNQLNTTTKNMSKFSKETKDKNSHFHSNSTNLTKAKISKEKEKKAPISHGNTNKKEKGKKINAESIKALAAIIAKKKKKNLSPSQVHNKLNSLLSQIKGVFSHPHSPRFLQKKTHSRIDDNPSELSPEDKILAKRLEAQKEKKEGGMKLEEARLGALENRTNALDLEARDNRPNKTALKPCCPGLFCSYHSTGAFTYCSHEFHCVEKQGNCRGPGSKCCGDLKCFEGVCSDCTLEGNSCEYSRCCGTLVCTFSPDGKFRVCRKEHQCIVEKGECDNAFKACCSPMHCWQGECRNCQKYKAPCSEKFPCCDGLHCRLDPGGIHRHCTYDPKACVHFGGKCDLEDSECCDDGFCNAQRVCQQCLAEGDMCERYPNRCCKGFTCTYDGTGKKKVCLRNPSCVKKDGSCAEPISCLTDEICCHGLICNTQKKCRPPFLLVNELCRFDTFSHRTEIEAPVFFSGDENLPIEPCKIPLVCGVDMMGEHKICLERETCVVLEGSCAHPESKCCPASFCEPESKKCFPCGTAHSGCDEENPCCGPLVCTYDPMGMKRMCLEKEQCIMKWGNCDGKGAFCCDKLECMKDPKSVESLKEFEKTVKKIMDGEFSFKEKFLPSRCLDCLPHYFKCNPDSDKKCCDGLLCGVDALGQDFECMESPLCLVSGASCGLPRAECCPGFLCNGQKKCERCLGERDECEGVEKMCCEGSQCRIDETGEKWRCFSSPVCVQESGMCKHIEAKCCEGMFCNRNSTCEKYPVCLEPQTACLPNDKPLPCCPPQKCVFNDNGRTRFCEMEQPCITETGSCGHDDLECCNGLFCDKGKCICSQEGEFCSEEHFCCGGLECVFDSWGGKKLCSKSQLCILEGGNCTTVACCEGLVCSELKAKAVLDSNGTMYTPNRTDLVCEKPNVCVSKPWAECSNKGNPCCEELMCTTDVFEVGEFCHPKAIEGSQCLHDEYCNFLYEDEPMQCIHNVCTPKNRKCAILAEECSVDQECCYGYECVVWGVSKRCKKMTGFRCEYEDDCVKYCDPLHGACCDEIVNKLEIDNNNSGNN